MNMTAFLFSHVCTYETWVTFPWIQQLRQTKVSRETRRLNACCGQLQWCHLHCSSTSQQPVTWDWLGLFHTRNRLKITAHVWLVPACPATPDRFLGCLSLSHAWFDENKYSHRRQLFGSKFLFFVSLANRKLQHHELFILFNKSKLFLNYYSRYIGTTGCKPVHKYIQKYTHTRTKYSNCKVTVSKSKKKNIQHEPP